MPDIDPERLASILDAGLDAQARARALGDEAEALRESLRRARLAEEAARRPVRRGKETVFEYAEGTAWPERVAALKAQLDRLNARRELQMAELQPVIELARRVYAHAREHHLPEVIGYDF